MTNGKSRRLGFLLGVSFTLGLGLMIRGLIVISGIPPAQKFWEFLVYLTGSAVLGISGAAGLVWRWEGDR